MKARRFLFATTLAAAFAIAGGPARADVSDVDRATARTLTLEGYEALDRKDFATAADRFSRADALYHAPTVTLGLAHAQVGLGKLVEAVATYSRIVHEGAPAGSPPAFTKAVDDARRELDALMSHIPNVIIVVHGSDVPKVTIDGVEVPSAALGVKRPVDPGKHVVRATAPHAVPSETTVDVLEGKDETVTLELAPEAPGAVAAMPTGFSGPPPSATPKPKPATEPPPGAGSTQRTLGIVALGVGAAGLGLGAVAGGLAISKHGSLVDQCPGGQCTEAQRAALQSDVDAYHTLGTLSTTGFVVGGAGLAAGAALLFFAPKHAQPEAALAPAIGPAYAGVTGRF